MMGSSPDIRQLAADYIFFKPTGGRNQGMRNGADDVDILLPKVMSAPLHILKTLGSMDEAIEALAISNIWASRSDTPLSISSDANIHHRIKVALWRFAVFEAFSTNAIMADRDSQHQRHESYLWEMSHEEVTDMARVYDDLSYMIQQAYPDELATEFASACHHYEVFAELIRKSCGGWSLWHEQQIMKTTEGGIDRFVDSQVARGLPFLYLLRSRISSGEPLPPTTQGDYGFFQKAFDRVMVVNKWGYRPNNYLSISGTYKPKHRAAYLLTSIGSRDGYKVSLLFGSRSTYYTQRLIHTKEEILIRDEKDRDFSGPYHDGREHWDECVA